MGKSDLDLVILFLKQMNWTVSESFEYRVLQKGYSGS
jgi:hypothetical protein